MDWKIEVVVLPVSDVSRAKEFYADRLGFRVDSDFHPNDSFHVVQVTPPGSALEAQGITTSGLQHFEDPDGNSWAVQQVRRPVR